MDTIKADPVIQQRMCLCTYRNQITHIGNLTPLKTFIFQVLARVLTLKYQSKRITICYLNKIECRIQQISKHNIPFRLNPIMFVNSVKH